MGFFSQIKKILPESDAAAFRRHMVSIVVKDKNDRAEFWEMARRSGFTEPQIVVMERYLAMADHRHQYHSDSHWKPTTSPLTDETQILEGKP